MDEILREVLIKKCGNRLHDQVLIIENLPRKFLYEQTRKLVPRVDRDGWMDGTMQVSPDKELIWTLYPGIELSQTGDGGYCFWSENQESANRLKDIMRYVDASFPRDQRLPEFVDNAQVRGESNTGPIINSQIPRIALPVEAKVSPAPAPVLSTSPRVTSQEPSGIFKVDKRSQVSPERKEQMRINLAKAREARKAKAAA